ncbi:MAG: winged helix-turn-helix domain-containing protein [Leucobacter sp.]|nr:winged helix-turn-helix domain-containing protein [Leucobacter sp.]
MALAAQGFSATARLTRQNPFGPALDRLHVLQIDSVNVFARSHYLPVFSRHGEYDPALLDDLLFQSGDYTEYWAHEAAFIRVEDRPLFAWRMRDFAHRYAARAEALRPELGRVRAVLADGGPQLVREFEPARGRQRGPWWDWSDTKRAVEILFATGEVVSAGRERFERRYALASETLPSAALVEVPRADAQRALVALAARALGVATLADLADYHRLKTREARGAVQALEEQGVLVPVHVRGWSANPVAVSESRARPNAWVHRDAKLPSRLAPNALLTPFDPVTWYRPRAERMFDFHYRIEIYTPKAKRTYGYYCLPLLVGGKLVGRIDLKADRAGNELLVQAAWQEPKAPAHTAEIATSLLARAARWQGLERVRTTGAGNLQLAATFAAA